VLWELLTLERLRVGTSAAGVLNEAIHGSLPDLSRVRPDVSRQLETVLWQALPTTRGVATKPRKRCAKGLLEYLATDPCSQEEVAELCSTARRACARRCSDRIGDCLKHADAQDPVISVTQRRIRTRT